MAVDPDRILKEVPDQIVKMMVPGQTSMVEGRDQILKVERPDQTGKVELGQNGVVDPDQLVIQVGLDQNVTFLDSPGAHHCHTLGLPDF